jgi:glutamate-5-semialdehyde dehydrogenase
MSDPEGEIRARAEAAREGAARLIRAGAAARHRALASMADALRAGADEIRAANARDLAAAEADGVDPARLDRLRLDEGRIAAMAATLETIRDLPDPVGTITELRTRPSGIRVGRMRTPIGVLGVVYESRPNVTAEAAGLCLKSGNGLLLRGGSEAAASNAAIARRLRQGLGQAGLPPEVLQSVPERPRALVQAMACSAGAVDLLIPRGGRGLIESITAVAAVPVLKHLEGNCHVFVDATADPEKAAAIVANAKTQRPATCNTAESLLVHEARAGDLLPGLIGRLQAAGVEVRGCPRTEAVAAEVAPATADDYRTEFLGPVIAARVVPDLDEALGHIATYGSGHSEAIVTECLASSERFLHEVDASSVLVNASTRFADGGEYGLGAEIGISTDRLHARGPVGAQALTTEKWVVFGDGHVRS